MIYLKVIAVAWVSMLAGLFTSAQSNLSSGLVAYYPFNGNARDESGNGNHPVFNNAVLVKDKKGNNRSAYAFDGKSQYMRIPNSRSLNFGGAFSISMQVKVMGFYQGLCHGNRILMKGEDDFETGNYFMTFDDNYYTGGKNCENIYPDEKHQIFYAPGISKRTTPKNYVVTGEWVTLTYISNGATCSMYVNCNLIASGRTAGYSFGNRYDLFLGKMNHWKFPYWYNGLLDEVRLYNRALTTGELQMLCEKPADKPKPAKPVVKVKPAVKPAVKPVTPVPLKKQKEVKAIEAPEKPAPLVLEKNAAIPVPASGPAPVEQRSPNIIATFEAEKDTVLVELYDNGEIDGDTVSVYFNDQQLVNKQRLTADPLKVTLIIDKNRQDNLFVMYAENLGAIPPNTALLVITSSNVRRELFLQSTEKSNGVVVFKLRRPDL